MSRKRYGVVLVTYGEVEKLSIRSLLPSSRKIVHTVTRQIVTLPTALIYALADYRTLKHFIDWKVNRYRSRLVAINHAQTAAVSRVLSGSDRLAALGIELEVAEAYYFVPPYLETVLQKFSRSLDGVVVVPMIPVESAFSCGVACQMAMEAYGEALAGKVRVMHGLWSHRELHTVYLDHIFSTFAGQPQVSGSKPRLVLVIHGTIVRDRNGREPSVFTGLDETYAFFGAVRQRIMADPRNPFCEVRIGCLNHVAGGEWTAETVEAALAAFRADGCESVAMFPFGYFADNSETDYEARKLLDASGIARRCYIPCINESPAFIEWLSARIAKEVALLDRQRGFWLGGDDSERNNHEAAND